MPRSVRPGETAIGEALLAALKLLARAGRFGEPTDRECDRRRPLQCRHRTRPGPRPHGGRRDHINGLCVLHEEPDLLESYTADVIGGPGAFAVTCKDYPEFAEAMRRKLRRELEVPIA